MQRDSSDFPLAAPHLRNVWNLIQLRDARKCGNMEPMQVDPHFQIPSHNLARG
jgi:hypothetical protein